MLFIFFYLCETLTYLPYSEPNLPIKLLTNVVRSIYYVTNNFVFPSVQKCML